MSADAQDLYRLSRNLENVALQLEQIAPELAKARTIRDFDGDRRRNLLAEYVAPLLADHSATAAETLARTNPDFLLKFKALSQDLMGAHSMIAKEGAIQAKFEAARSCLSVAKASLSV